MPHAAHRLLFFLSLLTLTSAAYGQVCNGSLGAPAVNETFGSGTTYGIGPQLGPGVTNLMYADDPCGGNDGTYTLLTSMGTSCKGGTWQAINHDHTGDAYGYMMVINASLAPSLFYTQKVDGSKLCPNTTYQFAAWIMNILRDLPQTQGYTEPNITFSIETVGGVVLKTYNTGTIPATDEPVWKQYGTFFTSPSDGSDLVIKMTNNGLGGNGNDLAMDDITFSPCGPVIQTGFGTIGDTSAKSSCVTDNLNYNLVAKQSGYAGATYQWQQNLDDGNGWVNIPGATTLTQPINIPDARAGVYRYRVGVLNKASISAESCRIFSDPLTINVYPTPVVTLSSVTNACIGQPLQLNSTGGDTYLWTGPNNFTSTNSSPLVTYHASELDNGIYTVKITRSNCSYFGSTTVKVSEPATAEPLSNVSICQGSSTQLVVKSTNGTTFKWYPAKGLDHDDIPNPVATPQVTTIYQVDVSNEGCPDVAAKASVTVTVNKNPVAYAGETIKIFSGQTAKLKATAAGDSVKVYWTPADYLDHPNSLTPITNSPANITYTLHVMSEVGCGDSTSSVYVRVYKKLSLINTFTPNGDGINDYWDIKNISDYPNNEVSVFTRYGQIVFKSIGYGKPWDGNYNGALLPAGTYYYIINLNDDNLPEQTGWLLIIR